MAALLALGLALAPTRAWAQAPSEAGDEDRAGASEAADERPLILLMADDDELGRALRRAVRTELNDVVLRLEAVEMAGPSQLSERLRAAEALVAEREALGLVWVESAGEGGGLVVYLVVADLGMLRRPIPGHEQASTTVETAAVVIRHYTTDLLAGRPIGLERFPDEGEGEDERTGEGAKGEPEGTGRSPAEAEPREGEAPAIEDVATPADADPELLAGRGRLRIRAAYLGETWARQRRWDSSAEFSVGWRLPMGLHLGLGAQVAAGYERVVEHPTDSGLAQLGVRRYPLAAVVGYQHLWAKPRLLLDAQLRVLATIIERRAVDPVGGASVELDRPLRAAPALEPRVQLDWLAVPPVSIFVGLGLRVQLIDHVYILEQRDEDTGELLGSSEYLDTRVVSPTLVLGLGLFL